MHQFYCLMLCWMNMPYYSNIMYRPNLYPTLIKSWYGPDWGQYFTDFDDFGVVGLSFSTTPNSSKSVRYEPRSAPYYDSCNVNACESILYWSWCIFMKSQPQKLMTGSNGSSVTEEIGTQAAGTRVCTFLRRILFIFCRKMPFVIFVHILSKNAVWTN